MGVDWSQFSDTPPAPAQPAVDWSQFSDAPPDQTQAGPPEASFRGIRADSATTATRPPPSPLSQFWSDVKAVPGNLATGVQALAQGGDYEATGDNRRVLGVGEGMLRDAADIAAGWANQAYQWSPMGVAERTAQQITSNLGGPTLPTMSNVFDAGTEAAHAKIGIDESTMRFQSPRQEAIARFVPELLSNAIPIGGAAHEADSLLVSGERALNAEARAGVHGPEAQGQAVADQLTGTPEPVFQGAPPKPIDITPEMQADVRTVQPEATPMVPDAAVGEPGAGIGQVAPEAPAAPAPETAPNGEVAGPELTTEPLTANPNGGGEPAPAEPLYHASLNDFEFFKGGTEGTASDPGVFGAGQYATGDERLAPFYLGPKKAEGTLYQVQHRMENPAVFDSPNDAIAWQGERGTDSPEAAARVRQKYLDAGHDGVVIRNPQTGRTMEAVTFDPAKFEITAKRPVASPEWIKTEQASTPKDGFVIRPEGWNSANDAVDAFKREGHFYRGMTQAEYDATVGRGEGVSSRQDFSVKNEGTSFSEDPRTAESYANFGRDDPRNTGKPNYLVEVKGSPKIAYDKRDSYYKAADTIPASDVTRVWRMDAENGAVVAREINHAQDVRVNQGPAGVQREIPAGGEVGGRGDLQRPGEQEPHALPQRLRGQGEAPARPVQEPLGPTGIAKEHVAAERERMGWEAVQHDLSRSDPEAWAKAQERTAANPNYAKDLTRSIIEKPRPISKEEANALAIDLQRIRTERRQAYAESTRALDAGDTEGAAQAKARVDRLDQEMQDVHQAARHASHEWGQSGRGLQRMANEDYSMANLVHDAKVHKGGELTPMERKLMEQHALEIEKHEQILAEHQARIRELEARPRNPRVAKDASHRFNDLAEQMKAATRKTLCELA